MTFVARILKYSFISLKNILKDLKLLLLTVITSVICLQLLNSVIEDKQYIKIILIIFVLILFWCYQLPKIAKQISKNEDISIDVPERNYIDGVIGLIREIMNFLSITVVILIIYYIGTGIVLANSSGKEVSTEYQFDWFFITIVFILAMTVLLMIPTYTVTEQKKPLKVSFLLLMKNILSLSILFAIPISIFLGSALFTRYLLMQNKIDYGIINIFYLLVTVLNIYFLGLIQVSGLYYLRIKHKKWLTSPQTIIVDNNKKQNLSISDKVVLVIIMLFFIGGIFISLVIARFLVEWGISDSYGTGEYAEEVRNNMNLITGIIVVVVIYVSYVIIKKIFRK